MQRVEQLDGSDAFELYVGQQMTPCRKEEGHLFECPHSKLPELRCRFRELYDKQKHKYDTQRGGDEDVLLSSIPYPPVKIPCMTSTFRIEACVSAVTSFLPSSALQVRSVTFGHDRRMLCAQEGRMRVLIWGSDTFSNAFLSGVVICE